LPRAALGKTFAEGLRGFAESLEPSAKPPAPVVRTISDTMIVRVMHDVFLNDDSCVHIDYGRPMGWDTFTIQHGGLHKRVEHEST
jgi:hypothetical protein